MYGRGCKRRQSQVAELDSPPRAKKLMKLDEKEESDESEVIPSSLKPEHEIKAVSPEEITRREFVGESEKLVAKLQKTKLELQAQIKEIEEVQKGIKVWADVDEDSE